jgi:hypothetical protein
MVSHKKKILTQTHYRDNTCGIEGEITLTSFKIYECKTTDHSSVESTAAPSEFQYT